MYRQFFVAMTVALLGLAGCAAEPERVAQQQAAGFVPPIPADRGRIIVFRDFETDGPPDDPMIYIAGEPAGVARPGDTFELDVPPGVYQMTTNPKHPNAAEITTVSVSPGSTTYAGVSDNWVANDTEGSEIPVFSIAAVDPSIGEPRVAHMLYDGSRLKYAVLR